MNSKNVVVCVAPHPDDETLGCGGTLLRHRAEGDSVHWLIVTRMTADTFSRKRIAERGGEIKRVAKRYDFGSVGQLNFPATTLDRVPLAEIIAAIGKFFAKVRPTVLYLPYRGDAHSDHSVVFDAAAACTKWFRHPTIRRVLSYETPSETDFSLNTDVNGFRPTVFVNIERWVERKLEIMRLYRGEQGEFPFPRSNESILALAKTRGAASGYRAAEAFMLLKERV